MFSTFMRVHNVAYWRRKMHLHASDSLILPNFSQTMHPIEKWEGKDLFSPPCIYNWRGISPPALQLVPPLIATILC